MLQMGDFQLVDIGDGHYYYSYLDGSFEFTMEPCLSGFDIAVYEIDKDNIPQLVQGKICTEGEKAYFYGDEVQIKLNGTIGHKAMKIVNFLYNKYALNNKTREGLLKGLNERILSTSSGDSYAFPA